MTVKRVALFVEGSTDASECSRRADPLVSIWNDLLCESVGVPKFEFIYPMSKKHLVAMDPRNPTMSGGAEPFDEYLARMLKDDKFEAAVVAWDLVPSWNPNDEYCRYQETLDLYQFLGQSKSESLEEIWKTQAQQRHAELKAMSKEQRLSPPRLRSGMVLALCMEPMFEVLMTFDEKAVRRALGLKQTPDGWPNKDWGNHKLKTPDRTLLQPAIGSLRRVRPKPACVRQVGGDFVTNKNGWGEYLLRKLLSDDKSQPQVLSTPFVERLARIRR